MNSIMYCYENRKVASFYCNQSDVTLHLTGYVEKFNESEVLIAHISEHGYYDGYILKHEEDIFRIDYDGAYEKKIEKLYIAKRQLHPHIDTFLDDKDEIFYSLLNYAKIHDLVITVDLGDCYLSGLVNNYEDDTLFLAIIDDSGAKNGMSVIKTDEILTVSVDTDDEQDLNILRRNS